jgi:effector-binding domain-containing protein
MRIRFIFVLALASPMALAPPTFGGTEPLDLKSVAAQRVLSVKVGSPREFPAAFEQLEAYCGHASGLHRVAPEMSLGSSRAFYAAVGFEGEPRETEDIKVLDLPPATVVTRLHKGPYRDLATSIKKLVDDVRNAGYTPDESAWVRLLHFNTPDTTAPANLLTEIQLPVIKR